jgi:hypothetical protein
MPNVQLERIVRCPPGRRDKSMVKDGAGGKILAFNARGLVTNSEFIRKTLG